MSRQNVRPISSMSAVERYELASREESDRGALDYLLEGETMASLQAAAARDRLAAQEPPDQHRRFEVPSPDDPRYERAVRALFSGRYDHLTGRELADLIDRDESVGAAPVDRIRGLEDSMTQVPGTQVTAAFITPECVRNRGVEGAWEEAVKRLREEYEAVLDGWREIPEQPTMNLILTMERPS